MTSLESSERIKVELEDFISNSKSLAPVRPANHEYPLIILYGQSHLGIPLHHIRLREIEAGREPPEFKACEVLLRGTVRGHVLFQMTIHNSNLKDCILVGCTIYGGKIETSQLKDCHIRMKTIGEYDTSPTIPLLSCCEIEGGSAHHTEIFNSTTNGVDSSRSVIESSLAIYSSLYACELSNCGIYKSKFGNCKVIEGIQESTLEYTLEFRQLPPEIRKMVFSYAIKMDGLSTGLIAALRPDPLLYAEVLETFYKEHIFVLSDENQAAFQSMSKIKLQRVTQICLKDMNNIPTKDASVFFPIGTKLTSIAIEYQGVPVDIQHFHNITKRWFRYFGTVVDFKVVWKEGDFGGLPNPPKGLKIAIQAADMRMGIKSVLTRGKSREEKPIDTRHSNLRPCRPVVVLGPELETFIWTWKGNVLRWNPL
ncbi:uncharacterized protein LY89DRAFT_684885 [Mollisia scopiformis]|uniref:Uncharacterized protein n=1 Tax=Mollisia scopiformis TaxID=149040 RepID=A0A194X9L6_MOLSC|nr:uncharacterized protein LY89DRAFT_684885 [Mollisia scopiformis]KUJ16858.1 hypothetical protein LY89DRAFT_684885 [Mollisia scopiformis]